MKKGLKKTLLSIGLSVTTLGASLFAGCSFVSNLKDQADQVFCEHETTKIVEALAPTCTEDGYTGYEKCLDCDKELTKGAVIKATGHTIEVTKGYAATCTTAGLTDKKTCAVCEEVIEEAKPIPALGHVKEEVEACEATCETDGFTGGYKCANCDYAELGEIIPALGHSYDDGAVTKEATCETDGEKTFTCATCEGTKVESIAATGHTFDSYTGVCTVCGEDTTTISGTWYFNEILSLPETDIYGFFNFGGFSTLEGDFSSIQYFDGKSLHYYIDQYEEEFVLAYDFNSDTWAKEGYRTVVIHEEEIVEGKFYAWLIENAVKQ